MIKIYGMPSCPDCAYIEAQVKDNAQWNIVNIGHDVRSLKEFLHLRDHHPVFDEAKAHGQVGIPCFVLPDGKVTLIAEEAGLTSRPVANGESCSLDGTGC